MAFRQFTPVLHTWRREVWCTIKEEASQKQLCHNTCSKVDTRVVTRIPPILIELHEKFTSDQYVVIKKTMTLLETCHLLTLSRCPTCCSISEIFCCISTRAVVHAPKSAALFTHVHRKWVNKQTILQQNERNHQGCVLIRQPL